MNRLKRLFSTLLVIIISISGICFVPATSASAEELWPVGPEVNAAAAILIEADTGAVLYEKDIHAQHYPASITKIMTTLLALENCSLQDTVVFSHDAINKVEGTQVGMTEGEELSLEQCLYGVMLASANEIAYAVAEHTGGSLDNFVAMMNARAAELGCTETHFSNPHGLPDETHYTSVHDMALIAREAYKNETFRAITRTVRYTLPPTNKVAEERAIVNHHAMLKPGNFHYEYCTGGKTGYTNAARSTLVTFAEKDGMALICVIMRDDVSNDQYIDTTAILDYGFNNFHKISLSENDLGLSLGRNGFFPIDNTPLSQDIGTLSIDNLQLVIPNQASLSDINTTFVGTDDDSFARINCSLENHVLGELDIHFTPGKDLKIPEATTEAAVGSSADPQESSDSFPTKTMGLVLLIIFCFIGFVAIVFYCIRNKVFR